MDATLRELLDLLIRWVHLIAGIMWIGNSMLFNWLDRNLILPEKPKEDLEGEIWLAHSGGFYQVERKRISTLPPMLHIFKWQAYTTWMSGFGLLVVVYYLGGKALLVNPESGLSMGAAVAVGLGLLVGAWLIYDTLWRSPLSKPAIAGPLSFGLVMAVAYGLTYAFSPRAAFMHVGAMLGTLMAGNVFMRIMPAQRQLIAATAAGDSVDPTLASRAKQRSIHNNYMTFPVLLLMIGNHFPVVYGHPNNWLLLGILVLAGAGVRHLMNIRFWFKGWGPALGATVTAAVVLLVVMTRPPAPVAPPAEPVAFSAVKPVIAQRCATCHSASPSDPDVRMAPLGVALDTPEQIKSLASRIKARAVSSQTMPLGNKTGMTEAERALLGRWIDQGAPIH